jgi:signal transduction histidine kinase
MPPAMVARTLTRLEEALARLAERAKDVELLASASLGLLRPHPVRVTLAELAATHDLEHADADADTVLLVDPDLMGRLLRDLWAAALLPPAPDTVALEVHRAGVWTDLRVVRRGAPMGHATLQTLFEPFDLNDDGSGITIGLYLARALAVAHGGTVGVDQDEESTTFWVRVPELSH